MRRPDDWDDDERAALDPVLEDLAALRERHRDNPPADLLRAARADALPESVSEAAASHLQRSPWSRALVDGLEDVEPTLDLEAQNRILQRIRADAAGGSADRRRVRGWLWAPALAAAAIVLTVLVLRRPRPIEQIAAAPPAASTASSTPAAPSTPAFHLPLDKPDFRFTAAALVLRGEGGEPRFIDAVAPAIRAYRAGDYATAERELAALQTRYPGSVEVRFYLGISRLFLGDAAGARAALEAARRVSDEQFAPGVDWYLAVADERAGRSTDARAALERLCGRSSEYRLQACEGAARLGSR